MVLRISYLEMTSLAAFRPAYSSDPNLAVIQAHIPLVPFYRFLYQTVGEPWIWLDRNGWTDEQLHATLAAANTSVYVLYVSGTPAGYIELDTQPEATEIAYFGLIPAFFGRGYGKHLLSFGVQRAWEAGAKRVWVHTCNLDGENALPNYEKRGFQIYKVEEKPMPPHYLAALQARKT